MQPPLAIPCIISGDGLPRHSISKEKLSLEKICVQVIGKNANDGNLGLGI